MSNTHEAITVKQLQILTQELITKGLGDRKILISQDDEGNGYHELFFGYTNPTKILKDGMAQLPFNIDAEKASREYVILG